MNKLHISSGILCLALSLVGQAQDIRILVPWSYAPSGAKMGMAARDLKTMLPDIKPMLGMLDGDQPDDSGTVKDGMYTSRSSESGYSEAMAYGIKGGRVTQVYWSSKKMASLADVKGFRMHLSAKHGESRLGYKAKVTKDGIAKLTTEVFSVKDTDLVISISSALGETEIAILDTADPNIDLNELYFSFEKQRERLRKELLRLTKNTPKDETDADSLDVLRDAIAAQSKGTPREQSNHGSKIKEKPDGKDPQVKKDGEEAIKISAGESSGWSKRYIFPILVAVIALACVLLVVRIINPKK